MNFDVAMKLAEVSVTKTQVKFVKVVRPGPAREAET